MHPSILSIVNLLHRSDFILAGEVKPSLIKVSRSRPREVIYLLAPILLTVFREAAFTLALKETMMFQDGPIHSFTI